MSIHATAIIDKKAEIDPTAEIGPYCVIGPKVKIGADSTLMAHVVVEGDTTIGKSSTIHPFASIGSIPQDLKFKGEPARLIIGDNNVIREGVTLNIGTEGGYMETRIGNNCLFMAYSHVAHDCIIGDHVILANCVGIAGHVEIADQVIFGGLAGIHQFCRVGRNAFISAGAMVGQDVPPFCMAQGDRAQLVGVNVIGLKRANWSRERINPIRKAFKKLFMSGPTRLVALEHTEHTLAKENDDIKDLTNFIRAANRGVCPPRLNNINVDTPDED